MMRGALPRGPHQVARKSARGKPPSSSSTILRTTLAESPLSERKAARPDAQEDDPKMSDTVPRPWEAERPPPQNPPLPYHMASVGIPPGSTPSTGVCRGQISDSCYQNIVELFAKRYITTFGRYPLVLEGAYVSDSTFSCRYIRIPHSSLPHHLSKCNISTLQGHSRIAQAISSLGPRIVFASPPGSAVTIDILKLPDMSYFVTMISDTLIEGVNVSVDMVFLLKESATLTRKVDLLRLLWTPFVVVSHQIILRS